MDTWQGVILIAVFNALLAYIIDLRQAAYKTELQTSQTKELDSFRAIINSRLLEHEKQFTRYHDRRFEVINEMFGLLYDAEAAIHNLLRAVNERDLERFKAGIETIRDDTRPFYKFYNSNRFYLDEETCVKLDSLWSKVWKIYIALLNVSKAMDDSGNVPIEVIEAFKNRMGPSPSKYYNELSGLRLEIERDIRKTLRPTVFEAESGQNKQRQLKG